VSMWIQLTANMSGTRANGDRYPPSWVPFEVADWEGENLVRAAVAQQVPAPPIVPPPPLDSPAQIATEPAPADTPAYIDARADVPVPAEPAPPAPGDPKQAWVDYAISQGLGWDEASRMTKADLQSRYGSRL
jgi:hypothetical protein